MTSLLQQPAVKTTLSAFITSRFVVLFGMLLVLFIPGNQSDITSGFYAAWYRWDAIHYVDIAVGRGYWYVPDSVSSIAFFPAYPMLLRALALVIPDATAAGMLISNVTFFLALIVIYLLAQPYLKAADSQRAVFYLALFPASLFFSAAYSESLFLLFSALTWYAARRGANTRDWRWWLIAGLSGLICSATRAVGLLVVLFPLQEWLRSHQFSLTTVRTRAFWLSLLHDPFPAFTMALIPVGLLVFMLYLALEFNDPLLFLRIQREGWGFESLGPVAIILRDAQGMLNGVPTSASAPLFYGWIDLAAFFLTLAVSVTLWRRMGWGVAIYSILSLLLPISSRTESMARYTAVLFPVFMVLALWGRHPVLDRVIRIVFILLLTLSTTLFIKRFFVG
ncbi:MAG: mannosyltransferase family protein [Anaerolineae bacterium]